MFLLSCDSNDGNDNIALSDLNGEWWTENCQEYSGNCDFTEAGIEDCESSEFFYIIIDNGFQQDCWTNSEPECPSDQTGIITLNGNSMIICSDYYTDIDDECLEGIVSIDEDSFQWIIIKEVEEDCVRTTRFNAERKE